MFTGIITDIGTIKAVVARDNGLRVTVGCNYDDVADMALGCSIAHDGVCLTVVQTSVGQYMVDVSHETVSCTNPALWTTGARINLERALKVGDELGGHIVSGHVDGVGAVTEIDNIGDNKKLTINAPEDLRCYIATKGSIAINGVSLTVNITQDNNFSVNLINHTLQNTTLDGLQVGDKVNLEIDMLARYLKQMHGYTN